MAPWKHLIRSAPATIDVRMGQTAILAALAVAALVVVGLRGLSRSRRRSNDAAADLNVSESWLAEQRGRGNPDH